MKTGTPDMARYAAAVRSSQPGCGMPSAVPVGIARADRPCGPGWRIRARTADRGCPLVLAGEAPYR